MKIIIDGKLYDTETAECVATGQGCQIIPIDQNEAKSLVGVHAPDQYDKYFGRAEKA
jgi:hypothetical protein